jgi:hypothetical protein
MSKSAFKGSTRMSTSWRFRAALVSVVASLALLTGGCPRPILDYPVTVEIYNNSDFEVIPDIRFDYDESIPASAAGDFLDIGLLLPGEYVQYDFDCDRIGLIFSDETEVRFFNEFYGIAERSFVPRWGLDFDCGDFIAIEFQGNPDDDFFDVLIFVNDDLIG